MSSKKTNDRQNEISQQNCGDKARNKGKYKRVMLKLSGEALRAPGSQDNISPEIVLDIAKQIKRASQNGVEIGVVVGGGNFWRGAAASARGMERATADHMGMLATVMNSLAMASVLESIGCPARVLTAIEMEDIAEPFIRRRAIQRLNRGRVVIFAAGTGNPYFSTDTAAALRANEVDADIVLKATKVDGVYDSDPKTNPSARIYKKLSFERALKEELKAMDATAFSLCMENKLKLLVFNMKDSDNVYKALMGEDVGTLLKCQENKCAS